MGVSTSRLDLSGDEELCEMKVKMKLRIATESRAETGMSSRMVIQEWSELS